jgi:hypothetical protein
MDPRAAPLVARPLQEDPDRVKRDPQTPIEPHLAAPDGKACLP